MVTAAMTGLFAKPQVIISAFAAIFTSARPTPRATCSATSSCPTGSRSWACPCVGAVGVWMAQRLVRRLVGLRRTAIPMIIVLTLIAANSTALTGIAPTGSLSKIPQFMYGAARPRAPAHQPHDRRHVRRGGQQRQQLLMDIKPGYMLGAEPRQQAIGHCIGVISGALASALIFYPLFLPKFKPGDNIQEAMVNDTFAFPARCSGRA
jgi:hypothetical protein